MAVYVLGVDPGFTGALAFYDAGSRQLAEVFDMPVTKEKKGSKRTIVDLPALAALIEPFAKHTLLGVIEDVAARPGQGVSSMFRFGYSSGAVAGVVVANLISLHLTTPAIWKSLMGVTAGKKTSRDLAAKLFPDHAALFARAKDDGRAEAALIAKFGERLLPLVQRRPMVKEI